MNVKLMGKLRQQICLKTKKTRKSKINTFNKITALIPKERLILSEIRQTHTSFCVFLAFLVSVWNF